METPFQNDNGNKTNILLYHQIGDTPNNNTNLDCFCETKSFYQQMEFLSNSDHEVISLKQAVDLICTKGHIDRKFVVLTFDDGCEKFYDITFPILKKFNFPSTIYPVVGCLGQQASWGLKNNPDLKILSKDMIIELSRLGVEIGAHTVDHVKLTQIETTKLIGQVRGSKDKIEQFLGKNIDSFAYPHGAFNKQIAEVVEETGFTNALTCINNYAETAESMFQIPRKYVTYFDTLQTFKQKLN